MKRKPTRKDLLIIIGRMQNLFGAIGTAENDRNPNRSAQLNALSKHGLQLAIDALAQDDPFNKPAGPWADTTGEDQQWQKAT